MLKIFFSALLVFLTVSLSAECLAETPEEIANKIAYGHAWTNHGSEFSENRKITNREMAESYNIATETDFEKHIFAIMKNNPPKVIHGNRKVYWDDTTGTIVFYDPYSNDCGTAFRPKDGKQYYERVLMRKESDKDRSKVDAHLKRTARQHYNQTDHIQRDEQSQAQKNDAFQCDGRIHCSQMKSCEEATFFLQHCPNTKMDGNGDGIPCEKQWCH